MPASEAGSLAAVAALKEQVAALRKLNLLGVTVAGNLQVALQAEQSRLERAEADRRMADQLRAKAKAALAEIITAEVVAEPSAPPARRVATPAPAQPPAPAVPRRSWSDWLAAFMEERNMRWGELVGGLLIVCCSIALVVSFWSEIAERPWLKFLLFNGVTGALFGVGFHSEHRWRLKTTSQGLLLISSLLVPLNFLAISAMTRTDASTGPILLAGEALSAALLGTALYYAGRVLLDRGAGWFAAGVLLPSLAQLLIRRYAGPQMSIASLGALAALPLTAYWSVNGWQVGRAFRAGPLGERPTTSLLKTLGVTSFATILPLALLLVRSGQPLAAARDLSLGICALGLPALAVGLLIWRRLAESEATGYRVAGTSVAIFGGLISLVGVAVTWPDPQGLLIAAMFEFVLFTGIAWAFGVPVGHIPAAICATLAYLLGLALITGKLEPHAGARELIDALISGRSGAWLVGLVAAYGIAAGGAQRLAAIHFRTLAGITGIVAALSVALVSWFGFARAGDPLGAGWVYLTYALAAIALTLRASDRRMPQVASLLLLAASVQLVGFRFADFLALPVITSLVAYSAASVAIGSAARRFALTQPDAPFLEVQWRSALTASIVAALWLFARVPETGLGEQFWLWGILAATWFAIAVGAGWLPVGTLAQAGLGVAVVAGVARVLERQDWFVQSARPWLDPWTLQAIGVALAALCGLWSLGRIAARRANSRRLSDALESPWLALDRAAGAGLIALLVGLAIYAVVPGAMQELSPRDAISRHPGLATFVTLSKRVVPATSSFELLGIPHLHAAGVGGWLLLAVVVSMIVGISAAERSARWRTSLFVAAAAIVPLVSARFESGIAVASALRWSSAIFLVVASAVIWLHESLSRQGRWDRLLSRVRLDSEAQPLVLALGLAPPLALGVGVAIAALAQSPHTVELWEGFWGLFLIAGFGLVGSGVLWLSTSRLKTAGARIDEDWLRIGAGLLGVACAAPALMVVVHHVGLHFRAHPILGPEPSAIFARMGLAVSYTVPLLLLAATLVGCALSRRSPGFALTAGLVLSSAATTGYLLAIAGSGTPFEAPVWIRLAQVNGSVLAIYSLAWHFARKSRILAASEWRSGPGAIAFLAQLGLAPGLMILALLWAWMRLVMYPHQLAGQVIPWPLADAWGTGALALVCASLFVVTGVPRGRASSIAWMALLWASAIFIAAWSVPFDTGNWLAYHTLYLGHHAVALALVALTYYSARRIAYENHDAIAENISWAARFAISLQGGIIFLMALREIPENRWWPVAGMVFLGVLLAPIRSMLLARRRYLYVGAAILNLAGTIAWLELVQGIEGREFFELSALLLALPSALWLWVETRFIRPRAFAVWMNWPPMHRTAARLALLLLAISLGIGLDADLRQVALDVNVAGFSLWALAAVGLAVFTGLWDGEARDRVALVYAWGLLACATLLDAFDLSPSWLIWLGAMVGGAYALATSYLWSRRAGLMAIADSLRVPRSSTNEHAGLAWLVPCNVILIAGVLALTFLVEFTNREMEMRIAASQAALVQVASLALLARGDRRGTLQTLALATGALGAIAFGFAWLRIDSTFNLLNGLVVVAAACALVAAFYGLGLGKLLGNASDWLRPAQRLTPYLAGIAVAVLAAILGVEFYEYARFGQVDIGPLAISIVAVTLAGSAVAAVLAAILPGRDPFGLTERGRTAYVYAAEIILALLFAHIRLTLPWLFTGFFQQYWPLIAMAIAYAGVGLAELFRRREQHVLAAPLENTGALLPLLPVLGYWAAETRIDYSLLLLTVGVLYGGLSIARRSFGFGVLAALAANGGLWYFLHQQEGLGFLSHPQVWLVPPALCVLAAAYLNRNQLGEGQMTAVRYLTSMTVYVSSTADIFLNGVAQAPWLPLVLGFFSILGVLAGIMLRVRAFLFLGVSFLCLALFTIIWHAAVDLEQTWIWYAAGIVAGIAVLVVFGLFEKKRDEMLAMLDKMRGWEN